MAHRCPAQLGGVRRCHRGAASPLAAATGLVHADHRAVGRRRGVVPLRRHRRHRRPEDRQDRAQHLRGTQEARGPHRVRHVRHRAARHRGLQPGALPRGPQLEGDLGPGPVRRSRRTGRTPARTWSGRQATSPARTPPGRSPPTRWTTSGATSGRPRTSGRPARPTAGAGHRIPPSGGLDGWGWVWGLRSWHRLGAARPSAGWGVSASLKQSRGRGAPDPTRDQATRATAICPVGADTPHPAVRQTRCHERRPRPNPHQRHPKSSAAISSISFSSPLNGRTITVNSISLPVVVPLHHVDAVDREPVQLGLELEDRVALGVPLPLVDQRGAEDDDGRGEVRRGELLALLGRVHGRASGRPRRRPAGRRGRPGRGSSAIACQAATGAGASASETQLSELSRVALPVLGDLHVQVEVDRECRASPRSDLRARVPTSLSRAPLWPMTMPFWESRST